MFDKSTYIYSNQKDLYKNTLKNDILQEFMLKKDTIQAKIMEFMPKLRLGKFSKLAKIFDQ